MNKKVLVIAVALLAVAMLATPFVGTVMAGKGQEKLYFKLYTEGMPNFDPNTWDRSWEAGVTQHMMGMPMLVLRGFYIQIGTVTTDLDPLDYSGFQDFTWNDETWVGVAKLREIITCFGGTLEILAVYKMYNFLLPNMYVEGTFVGHGTGALEGVKVEGTISGIPATPAYLGMAMTREGTVMGWPT